MIRLAERIRANLPAVYELDDVRKCQQENNLYCEVHFTLYPKNNGSAAWKLIEEANDRRHFIPFQKLTRFVCLQRGLNKDENYYKNLSQNLLDQQIKQLDLGGSLESFYCSKNDGDLGVNIFDYMLIGGMFLYFTVLLCASFSSSSTTKRGKFLKCFSVPNNFRLLGETSRDLKFIEGIRSVTMLGVLFIHSLMKMNLSRMENPEDWIVPYTENSLQFYLVQFFFVTSGWFLMCSVCSIIDINGGLTLIDVAKLGLARFLRFLPSLLVILLMLRSSLWSHVTEKLPLLLHKFVFENCEDHWLKLVLFYNNVDMTNACLPHTWYLSVDMQLYQLSLVFLYITQRLKMNKLKILAGMFVLTFAWHVTRLFSSLSSLGGAHLLRMLEKPFSILQMGTYYPTLSNAMTVIMAIYFGWLYSTKKNCNVFTSKTEKIGWLLATIFCFAALFTVDVRNNGALNIVLIAALKPVYSLGWCLLIFGLTQNLLEPLRKFFEWRWFLYMANFNYAIYIVHFSMYLLQLLRMPSVRISTFDIAFHVISDFILTIVASLIFHLMFDKPFQNLLKIYGPKVKKIDVSKNK